MCSQGAEGQGPVGGKLLRGDAKGRGILAKAF